MGLSAARGLGRMRLLVTGGAGYIGSVCAARLVESGHDVVVLDDLSTGHRDAVPEGFIRLSAGCEDTGDLVEDVERALRQLQ